MRVLYITEYQGAAVLAQRNHRRNRALGAARKVELFAAALRSAGHDLHVVSTGAVSEATARWYRGFTAVEPECAGVPVTYLPGFDVPRANMLIAAWALRRFLQDVKAVDVILLYNLEWLYLRPVLDFCRSLGVPLVLEYEDDVLQPIVGTRLSGWYRRRGRHSLDAARGSVAGLAAVSEKLADQFAIGNSIVIPGAVDDALLSLHPPPLRPTEPMHLLYAGSLTPAKGVRDLVEAISHLGETIFLDVVGTGPDYDRLRDFVSRRSLPAQIHGEVSREQLAALYGRAHLAVNPHVMTSEMLGGIFPFKIVEYIGAGLPVVSTELQAVPDVLAPALVMSRGSSSEELTEALCEARRRYVDLTHAVGQARDWIAREYSRTTLAGKLDTLLRRAAKREGSG